MARKLKKYRSGNRRTKASSRPEFSSLSRAIFLHLFNGGYRLQQQELFSQLEKTGYSSAETAHEIKRLQAAGFIRTGSRKKLQATSRVRLYKGELDMTASGFGFATKLRTAGDKPVQEKDVYIRRSALLNAGHGDTIVVMAVPGNYGKKTEGHVLSVVSRKTQNLVGFVVHQHHELLVYPEDPRYPFTVLIRKYPDAAEPPEAGKAVMVNVDDRAEPGQKITGRIVEVLGDPNQIEVLTRMTAEKHQLPCRFSPEAEAEAERASFAALEQGREDLRDIQHVTIDGADARDFDDAVAVVKTRNGYRLYVSIADVSALVKPGSSLDIEAYARGTSVYFPGAVIPMLPENLSNNLCSLVPEEDRPTVTAILDFDRTGVLQKKRFVRSLIRSRMRFTYDTVKKITIDRDPAVRRAHKNFLTPLKWATKLAEALLEQRRNRGSILLNLAEADIRIGDDDAVVSVTKRSRHFAHQIVEEFMLAANEAVAHTLSEHGRNMLYRIHEEPDPAKVAAFIDMAQILGLELPGTSASPAWFANFVRQAQDTDREFIVNSLLLRTMQQARYHHLNTGHFGLGATHYTHFTSPIRRYPDLIVHRLLCRQLGLDRTQKRPSVKAPYKSLQEAGLHLSTRERNAVAAERDVMDKLKCRYMQGRIGEHFSGIISAVTDSLIFIDLVDHLISGAAALSDLTDDYYLYDAKRYRLVGDVSGFVYQIGDAVTVEVIDVDMARNKIFFTVVA